MNERNTKQKEIILRKILEIRNHPTMIEIVKRIKSEDASIGQATVYRNINKLVLDGKINKIYGVDGSIHYDGETKTCHDHFICIKCGVIIDLYDNDYKKNKKMIEEKYSVKVNRVSTMYEGICNNCQNKLEKR